MSENLDDLSDVTDEERAAAEALARALERPAEAAAGSDAAFVLGLRATQGMAPPLSEEQRERAIDRAIDASRRGNRRRIWGPVLLAAVVLLAVVPAARLFLTAGVPAEAPTLVVADALFSGPFEETQRPGERVSRIARARTRGYFEARRTAEGGRR